MTDLFVAYRREDKERADLVKEALSTLGLAVHPDIDPKGRGGAKAIRAAAASATAVLVLWPEEILDPTANLAGLYGLARSAHERGRLACACLAPLAVEKLEGPFHDLPAPDLSVWLADGGRQAGDTAWQCLLKMIGALLGRPALGDHALALAADGGGPDGPAQRAFARKHPEDPAALALWARFEAAERERFASEFRKAHAVLVERGNAAQEQLRATIEAFSAYLKAVRSDPHAVPPDPKAAILDGAAALRESVARLSGDNERLRAALERAVPAAPPAPANANRSWKWIGVSAAAFLVGSLAAGTLTEFAGPLRGDSHPRIAALSRLAQERSTAAQTSGAEVPRLREVARAATRRAETAEANLRVARTQLAHSQTELIQRQNQAAEASGQSRRAQTDLQTAQAAVAAAETKAQEAAARLAGVEQELRTLREAQAAADSEVTTGSVRQRQPDSPAAPAAASGAAQAPAEQAQSTPQASAPQANAPLPVPRPEPETTGSVPRVPPAEMEAPHRHRRDRWSFAVPPDLRLDSENDLPGPVNSVLVHAQSRDAVVVISANNARATGSCTPQAWYWDTIVEGAPPRRGEIAQDADLPAGDAAFQGFTVRGRGVLQAGRFRNDLDYYDLVAQRRNEPGVVYLVQARFPRAMASDMVRSVNALWKSFEISGQRPYPTRC